MGLGGKKKEAARTSWVFRYVKFWRWRGGFCFSSLLLLLFIIAVKLLRASRLFSWQQPTPSIPNWSQEVESLQSLPVTEKKRFRSSVSNQALLAFVTIDPVAEQERNEAKQLLDASFEEVSGWRSTTHVGSYRRGGSRRNHHDLNLRSRGRNKPDWRALLASPRYMPLWPQFRLLLKTWVLKNRAFQPTVMQELVSTIKEMIDKPDSSSSSPSSAAAKSSEEEDRGSSRRRYNTCAVVGNSGMLLNRSYGVSIDGHEMVMRLNNAKTVGFERFVGSKTTVSFVNSNILHQCSRKPQCFCHLYGAHVPIVVYLCQLIHFMDVAMCSSSMQKAPLIVTDPRFDSLTARIVKWYSAKRFVENTGRPLSDWSDAHEGPSFHYSSGMQAVMLALGICDNVNLFGFGKLNGTKHHYHTSQKSELHLHDYEAEYCFYRDLVNRRFESIPFLDKAGIEIPAVHIFQ
ncbi:hypothetical protein CY35_17G001900 [Sphagnum magellanicum]|nr:hypothetical protein CY35_17G001900 [Sphagnum magellanicum]KAH9534354.1 hypothetical protein CY35_17G001900 [Sphagnum magellanicum]